MNTNLSQFLTWLRNGTCFCVTWFLLLLVLFNQLHHRETIATESLMKLILLSFGGVLLFCLLFSKLVIKRWHFVTRLTCFMLLFSLYECVGLYWIGFFQSQGTLAQWLTFIGIVMILYITCIVIYQQYSKKQGALYTQALQQYQQKRSSENGK